MLFAHWCYFGAGIFALVAIHNKDEVVPDDMRRFSALALKRNTMLVAEGGGGAQGRQYLTLKEQMQSVARLDVADSDNEIFENDDEIEESKEGQKLE